MFGLGERKQIVPVPLVVITRCTQHRDILATFPFGFAFAYSKKTLREYKKLVAETQTPFEQLLLIHLRDEATKSGMVRLAKMKMLPKRCHTNAPTEDVIEFHSSFHWQPIQTAVQEVH